MEIMAVIEGNYGFYSDECDSLNGVSGETFEAHARSAVVF